jgi:hypothetical protein
MAKAKLQITVVNCETGEEIVRDANGSSWFNCR